MITIRPASERGHGQYGWLDTYHSFSFNDDYDPRHMGFRVLRVLNDTSGKVWTVRVDAASGALQ